MEYNINGDMMIRGFVLPMNVVEKSLKLATADHLKVLLLIMSDTSKLKSVEELSEILGITLEAVREAITFWVNEEILKVQGVQKDDTLEESERILAMRHKLVAERRVYSQIEIGNLFKDNADVTEIRNMAEQMKGKPLTHRELNDICVLADSYALSAQFIMTVMGYCTELGKSGMKAVRTDAEAFYINGVDDDTIDRYVSEKLKFYRYSNNIKILLGLKDKHFNERDTKMLESWKTEFKMSDELIKYAFDICLLENNNAFAIRYQNKVLKRWYENSINSLEEAQKDYQNIKNTKTVVTATVKTDSKKKTSVYEDIENLIAGQLDEPW